MLALVLGDVVESVRTRGLHVAARPRRRAVRKVCAGCERQRALFRYHGVVKWDRYHTLCFRCFRAQVDSLRHLRPGLHA
jgi:hypothetical protein